MEYKRLLDGQRGRNRAHGTSGCTPRPGDSWPGTRGAAASQRFSVGKNEARRSANAEQQWWSHPDRSHSVNAAGRRKLGCLLRRDLVIRQPRRDIERGRRPRSWPPSITTRPQSERRIQLSSPQPATRREEHGHRVYSGMEGRCPGH
jgi:hypothetical protein